MQYVVVPARLCLLQNEIGYVSRIRPSLPLACCSLALLDLGKLIRDLSASVLLGTLDAALGGPSLEEASKYKSLKSC